MRRLLFIFSLLSSAIALSAQTLPDSVQSLNDVVVTGSRNVTDVRFLPYTVSVVGREVLTQNEQPSVLTTLNQQVPGLFVTSRGMMGYGVSGGSAGGLSIRGIADNGQTMVLIDGHPQYNGIYGHPISDSYQTSMAERVEVVRGPASVLYGSNAMGGVVNIVTRKPSHDGVWTNVNVGGGSYGTFQSEATNQVRSGKFSSTVSAHYNRSDNHRPRMGFEQYGGYAKVGYDFNSHWKAYIDANIIHFNAHHPGSESSPLYDADQWITRGMVSAGLENRFDKINGALSVYTNFGRHKIDDGTADPTKPTARYFRSKDELTGVSLYETMRFFKGNLITAGFDYQHIFGRAYYTSKADGKVLDTPNKQSGKSHRNEVAGYIDVRQDVVDWLTVGAGIRVDHHSISGIEWVPQAGLVVRPIDNGEIKAVASKGFRNPTMREMYLYPPSNEELKAERMWNYELSWGHRLGNVKYGVNLFYVNADNVIQQMMVESKPRLLNVSEIENYGLELDGSWKINSHWVLNTNHSFLHMETPVLAAPEYKGFLGATFNMSKWTANLGVQYLNGLYTAVGTNEKKENACLVNATVKYQLLDNLRLWVRGENLLAQKYEINAGFPMPKATFMGGVNFEF